MSLLRKLLSALIINAAVFMVTLSFTAWVLDAKLLNAEALTASFDKNNLARALTEALPKLSLPDKKDGGQGGQSGPEIVPGDPNNYSIPNTTGGYGNEYTVAEKAQAEAAVRAAIDEPYVRTKMNGLVTNVIGFIKTGTPQPTIDLSEVPERIKSATGEIPEDMAKELSQPINLAEKTDPQVFETVHKSYDYIRMTKIVAPIVAVILLALEWFLTPKGKRLGKTAWVFIVAGAWGIFWWLMISFAPELVSGQVRADQDTEIAMVSVLTALLKSLSTLLADSFLKFGLASLGVAAIILIGRSLWRRFGPVKGAVVPMTPSGKPAVGPPKR